MRKPNALSRGSTAMISWAAILWSTRRGRRGKVEAGVAGGAGEALVVEVVDEVAAEAAVGVEAETAVIVEIEATAAGRFEIDRTRVAKKEEPLTGGSSFFGWSSRDV